MRHGAQETGTRFLLEDLFGRAATARLVSLDSIDIIIKILNSNYIFLICFSYYFSKLKESFIFIFKSLQKKYFNFNFNFLTFSSSYIIFNNQAADLIIIILKIFFDY